MLSQPGLTVAASVCKRLDCGNAFCSILSIRRSNFRSEILAPARNLTTLHVKMSAAKSSWKPKFVPVTDSGATAIDPKCLLRVVSYNILAQAYVKSASFPHSPRSCLRWKNRSEAVVARLLALDADLLCLQELDEYHTFYKEILHRAGFGSIYVQRANGKKDGCGIFFKRTRISLLSEEVIDYNVLVPPSPTTEEDEEDEEGEIVEADGSCETADEAARRIGDLNDVRVRLKRDCVGIMAAFKLMEAPHDIFVLANTHIYWDPVLIDVKLAQAHHLASSLMNFTGKVTEEYGMDPLVIIAGDFNSLPGDPVYNYLVSGTDSCKQVKTPEKDVNVLENKVAQLGVETEGEISSSSIKEWVVELDRQSKFPLPAVSLYAYTDEEPAFTNYTHNFVGTLDYILFVPNERLKPKTLLTLPRPGAHEVIAGLPNHYHPSDHLPIGCEFGLY